MASEEDGEAPVETESGELPAKKQRFYFESDMLALKSNTDYQKLLKTLAILEAQKIQSIKDLETLSRVQLRAERDPHGFVHALKNGTLEPLPMRQKVAEVPEIDWKPYIDSLQSVARQQSTLYRRTRRANIKPTEKAAGNKPKAVDKPASYRQVWSQEEQARFEELLQIYPPEQVEMRRFEKIAAALKTRTPLQVASHVQKYFIKLARAGLPVPGKVPNIANYGGKWKKSSRSKRSLSRPSTFFAGLAPRVYMTESSGTSTPSYEDSLCEEDSSDDDSVVAEWVPVDPQTGGDDNGQTLSIKCCNCEEEVTGGVYWQCTECPQDSQTTLCPDCVNSNYCSTTHSPSHDVQPQSLAGSTFADTSYTGFTPQLQAPASSSQHLHPAIGYNYLDPNFYPAS